MNKCYYCGKESSSKEHAPAKCFFPEGNKFRKNLIKVDSCNDHNEKTSDDDQYVRDIIVLSIFNSEAANSLLEKVERGLRRKPAYLKSFLKEIIKVKTFNFETISFSIDRERFNSVIIKYSYAIYYHFYKERWTGSIKVLTDKLYDKYDYNKSIELDDYGKMIQDIKLSIGYPPEDSFIGDNPEVFKYIICDWPEFPQIKLLIMKFYNYFDLWMLFDKNNY